MALLSAMDLTLGYSDRTLVRNLNFELNEGNYLCIVGENGSGKSTLMRTLLGLQAPLSGKVLHGDGLRSQEITIRSTAYRSRCDRRTTTVQVNNLAVSRHLVSGIVFCQFTQDDNSIADTDLVFRGKLLTIQI